MFRHFYNFRGNIVCNDPDFLNKLMYFEKKKRRNISTFLFIFLLSVIQDKMETNVR